MLWVFKGVVMLWVFKGESLSDWVRTIRSLVQGRIHRLKNCVNSRPKSVFLSSNKLMIPLCTFPCMVSYGV
jgi:hypothetical protein